MEQFFLVFFICFLLSGCADANPCPQGYERLSNGDCVHRSCLLTSACEDNLIPPAAGDAAAPETMLDANMSNDGNDASASQPAKSCTIDTDASEAEQCEISGVCDVLKSTCLDGHQQARSLALCEQCASDAHCQAGYYCVRKTSFRPAYCVPMTADDPCDDELFNAIHASESLNGITDLYCFPNGQIGCEKVGILAKDCNIADPGSCNGHICLEDGKCHYLCQNSGNCPSGFKCKSPEAGAAKVCILR